MTASNDGLKKGPIEGSSLSPNELIYEYGIPREEIASFQGCTFIYPGREVIIQEGEHENALYLLRIGTVEVFKGSGAAPELIDTIEAVNFFGEMGLINDQARSATVISLTKNVVVYRIANPNIQMILNNPKWAELLISRLCRNLARSNQQQMVVSEQAKELRNELEQVKNDLEKQQALSAQTARNTRLALNGVLYFQDIVQGLAVMKSKGWVYLNALSTVTRALISHYITNLDPAEKRVEIHVIRKCLGGLPPDEKNRIIQELNEKL